MPGEFDFSMLQFPVLEKLALGYYTVAHDDQMDWIYKIKSLKSLVMHRCMILRDIRIPRPAQQGVMNYFPRQWEVNTRDWERAADLWNSEQWTYAAVWSDVFDRLTASLPRLEDFVFSYLSSSFPLDEYGVHARNEREVAVLFPQRYVAFDCGTAPSPWLEAKESGDPDYGNWKNWQFHLKHKEVDEVALESLLEACKKRRRQAS